MLQQRSRFQPLSKCSFEPIRCRLLIHGAGMKRREFLGVLSGAVAAWPLTARAQQGERVRRIGVFMDLDEGDPEGQARVAALKRGLRELGWIEGRNLRIDLRWAAS